MFLLTSNDHQKLISIQHYLNQKNNFFTLSAADNYFTSINLEFYLNKMTIMTNFKNINLKMPLKAANITNYIFELLRDYSIKYDLFNYCPIQQFISFENKKINLNNIHNSILSNLLLNQQGIDKNILYKLIWPSDKIIYINKLDTHLTNLKNKFKENFNYNIKINTLKGVMCLSI